MRAVEGTAKATWTQDTELLASIVDVTQYLLHVQLRAHFEGKPKAPSPFPRPWDVEKPEGSGKMSTSDFAALFGGGVPPSRPQESAS